MPILIRILIQRLLWLFLSVLTFFGINPDISVPTAQVVEERKEIQQERIDEVLHTQDDASEPVSKNDTVAEVESKITEIQKEFTQSITQPVVDSVQNIVPSSLVYNEETPAFNVKDVVVNINCLEKTSTYTRLSSGSGVIISPAGVVLTNAHVTYPFLQTSQFDSSVFSCSIRRENIPNYGYNAELVYYPSDWLSSNSEIIKDPAPVGTGENDYALLQITSPLGPTPKGSTFPYVSTSVTAGDLKENKDITVAGYPSTNSGVFEIDTKPGLKVAQSHIVDFFTFASRSYDVLQTGVNDVAHRGASGGGVFSSDLLYGIVVTTNTNSQGSYINALTIPYIKRDFKSDTGLDFDEYVNSSFDTLKVRFSTSYKENIKRLISSS